MGVVHIL
ncbi:hypothetical protein Tco_0544577, partial [Tanacetum coccineum]